MSRAIAIPAGPTPPRLRAASGIGALCVCVLALVGCKRADEAQMRTQLAGWVSLGDTVSFTATRSCAAGVFQLVGTSIASRMRIAGSVREAVMILKSRDAVAIDAPGRTPDAILLELVDTARGVGMRMRMAGLEARACMDGAAEAAFAAALVDPQAVVLMDRAAGTLALMNGDDGLLVVAMGAE